MRSDKSIPIHKPSYARIDCKSLKDKPSGVHQELNRIPNLNEKDVCHGLYVCVYECVCRCMYVCMRVYAYDIIGECECLRV